jgi:hypothetical protein
MSTPAPAKPSFFKDLNKRLSDLLTKEYPSEKQENTIEWKGTTEGNVTVENKFTQKKDGSWFGTLMPKYRFKQYNTTVSGELNTKKEWKVEAAVEDKLVDGLKTTVAANSKGDDNFATFGLDYKHEYAALSVSAEYGKPNGSTVKPSFVVAHQGFFLGALAEYFVGTESSLKDLHTILGYSATDYEGGVFGRIRSVDDEEKNEIGLNYFQRVNDDLSFGAEIAVDTANAEVKPKLTLGSRYVIEKDSVVKTKFDTDGKLGFSYNQKFNKNTKLTLSSTVDTNNFSSKGSGQFGFALSFEY